MSNTALSPHSHCHRLFPTHEQPFFYICCTCGDKPFRGITKCSMYHAHSHKTQHAHTMNSLPPHKDRDDFPILQHPTDPVLSHPQLPLSLLCSSHRSCGEDEQKNALTHFEDPLALPWFTLTNMHMQLQVLLPLLHSLAQDRFSFPSYAGCLPTPLSFSL